MARTSRTTRAARSTAASSILPSPGTRVYGRDEAARRIADELQRGYCRLLTLTGAGGGGKTTLALHAAQTAPAPFAGGAVFVPLAALPGADLIPAVIARALGLPETSDPSGQIAERARRCPLLILLDNLEHLAGARDAVASLLAAADRITILATSRIPLGLDGELIERVEPFATEANPDAASLWANPGVRLFVDRAPLRRHGREEPSQRPRDRRDLPPA